MAHVELALVEQALDLGRKLEQPQQVRHRRARAADRVGGLLVRQVEFVDQPRQRLRFFERREILALDVLDQRHRDDGLIGHLP